jgi:hypothetical protein
VRLDSDKKRHVWFSMVLRTLSLVEREIMVDSRRVSGKTGKSCQFQEKFALAGGY